MAERKYYVTCDSGCKFESMTKEQILSAITQAVNDGTVGDIDIGFVTTIKTINGKALKFFFGQQSEYETLTAEEKNGLFAIITNDTNKESILSAIETLSKQNESLGSSISDILSGEKTVAKAEKAGSLLAEQGQIEVLAGEDFEYNFETDCFYIVEVTFGVTVALFVKCYAIGDLVCAESSCAHALVGAKRVLLRLGSISFFDDSDGSKLKMKHRILAVDISDGSQSLIDKDVTLKITKMKIAAD